MTTRFVVQPAVDPPLLTHLYFSHPATQRGAVAGAAMSSLFFHAVVLSTVVWLSVVLPRTRRAAPDETVIPLQLMTEVISKATSPAPPPPPPPEALGTGKGQGPTGPQISAAEMPKGFQVLAMPTVTPVEIPAPSTSVTNEADFTGEGVEGGRSWGRSDVKRPPPENAVVVTAERVEAAPVFTPHTVAPELKNAEAVIAALQRYYPAFLKDAGLGGTVLVWVLVDEKGGVMKTLVKEKSEFEALDEAALKVAELMRFSPGYNREVAVKVWVALPIHFVVR